ncbi:unnamed protein product [Urochloa decumbens]|uniref:serine C-palmitoyltransferase n=1 Tax=Urochloa decumbens TaxID=240449 RepID=A0ABC9AQ52_9POAL
MATWDMFLDAALASLAARKLLFHTQVIALEPQPPVPETFMGPGSWDRATVEFRLESGSQQEWLSEDGEESLSVPEDDMNRKLILFSGNDYMCLSSHPAVREAAAKDCILCPTGFSANLAVMTALGSISSLLSVGRKPAEDERVAIFSDALNHASIIDGIRLVERQKEGIVFVYKHCDMSHLDFLLSSCSMGKKIVITDSLFSMDGDFAPLPELVKLRKKHGFLLVVDDAHGTLVCGDNGGGVPEMFACQNEIDISIGTLSKAVGCLGGFISCSNRWKRLIVSRGRTFIFSTALPVPIVASVHAAIYVSNEERWRRSVIWGHVQYFASLTKIDIKSHVISIVVGSEDAVLKASRHLLRSGYLVTPIRPPFVPPNSCRLRITLSVAHSLDDIKRLVDALTPWLPAKHACMLSGE